MTFECPIMDQLIFAGVVLTPTSLPRVNRSSEPLTPYRSAFAKIRAHPSSKTPPTLDWILTHAAPFS